MSAPAWPVLAPSAVGLSVVMAAHDEQAVIGQCLESVKEIASEVVVVDAGSSDGTAGVASEHGATVLRAANRLMLNENKNLAIDAASCPWVLLLDPDERVSPQLASEIRTVVSTAGRPESAYWIPRRNRILGRWIRTMGMYPDLQLRLFRRDTARFACRSIHEMVEVTGPVGQLTEDLLHEPPADLWDYVHKRNLYSEHRAEALRRSGTRFKAQRLVTRPLWAFVKQYLLRRGWREGVAGLVICVSAAYGTFLQDAKLWQRWQEKRVDDANPASQHGASRLIRAPLEPSTTNHDG